MHVACAARDPSACRNVLRLVAASTSSASQQPHDNNKAQKHNQYFAFTGELERKCDDVLS